MENVRKCITVLPGKWVRKNSVVTWRAIHTVSHCTLWSSLKAFLFGDIDLPIVLLFMTGGNIKLHAYLPCLYVDAVLIKLCMTPNGCFRWNSDSFALLQKCQFLRLIYLYSHARSSIFRRSLVIGQTFPCLRDAIEASAYDVLLLGSQGFLLW